MAPFQQLMCLETHLRQGFCLHGSPYSIEGDILPRQAICSSGRPENNQYAVYAEPDDLRIPCFMAMHVGGGSSYSVRGGVMTVRSRLGKFQSGYVYILPKDSFVTDKGAFYSFASVRPVDYVIVTPLLFELFKNFKPT